MANKFETCSKEELYGEEIICQIMDEKDPLIREQMKFDLIDRVKKMIVAFGKIGVTQEQIEKRLGRKVDTITLDFIVDMWYN